MDMVTAPITVKMQEHAQDELNRSILMVNYFAMKVGAGLDAETLLGKMESNAMALGFACGVLNSQLGSLESLHNGLNQSMCSTLNIAYPEAMRLTDVAMTKIMEFCQAKKIMSDQVDTAKARADNYYKTDTLRAKKGKAAKNGDFMKRLRTAMSDILEDELDGGIDDIKHKLNG